MMFDKIQYLVTRARVERGGRSHVAQYIEYMTPRKSQQQGTYAHPLEFQGLEDYDGQYRLPQLQWEQTVLHDVCEFLRWREYEEELDREHEAQMVFTAKL